MRRLTSAARVAIGVVLLAAGLLAGPGSASAGAGQATATAAEQPDDSGAGFVNVVEVSGLLDPVLVDFVESAISASEADGATALVLQLNSGGAAVPDERFRDLARAIRDAEVPVAIWVGPSGSKATGEAAQLLPVADAVGVAPGSRVGDTGRIVLPESEFGALFGEDARTLRDRAVSTVEAQDLGIADRPAPTVGDFIVDLPGVETRVIEQDGERRREPVTQVRFAQLSLIDQLFHTVASAAVTYLLLIGGLALIVFELYTAGVGVAGLVGALSLILACYGLGVLPVNPWAVGMMVVAFVAFAIDVQTGVPRVWTGIGMALFVVATFTLFEDGVSLSWITIGVGVIGILLTFLAGMPSMVRTRFSTPTIGREWMIGETGEAAIDVAPEGTVRVRDALWQARTNRATPITAGERIRVVEVTGLVLEVEPEAGGARDHRDR